MARPHRARGGPLGAFRFIEKPLSKDYVLDAAREGLELGTLRRENRQMKTVLETRHELVGQSPALAQVLDDVRRAAPTNATVLILGERRRRQGTGRAGHSSREPAIQGAFHSGQLRRDSRRADRVRTVRSRTRLVHRGPPTSRLENSSRPIAGRSSWTKLAT
jgi:hypothetical protein